MEKGKLTQLLENFKLESNLSVELYFVFKNADNVYQLYSTKPDETLKKELIDSYAEELTKFGNPHSAYELHSIYNDNEMHWNYLYYDNLGTTKISSEIFTLGEDIDITPYSTEIGDYGSIFGFVIDLYNGITNQTVRVFKKALPTQAMKRSKVFGISFNDDGRFKSMDKDTVFFQKNIDIFQIEKNLIIKNYNVYESSFKFDEILKLRVQDSLKVLLKIPGLEFTQNAIEYISHLTNTRRKKLINCVIDNKIITDEKYKTIKSQAKRYLKHEFKVSPADKIIVNSKKDVNNLITILNREINKNSATNEVFHTPSKKLLSIYVPKKQVAN